MDAFTVFLPLLLAFGYFHTSSHQLVFPRSSPDFIYFAFLPLTQVSSVSFPFHSSVSKEHHLDSYSSQIGATMKFTVQNLEE